MKYILLFPCILLSLFAILCDNNPDRPQGLNILLLDTAITLQDTILLKSEGVTSVLQGSNYDYDWQCDTPNCLIGKLNRLDVKFTAQQPGHYSVEVVIYEAGLRTAYGYAIIEVIQPVLMANAGNDTIVKVDSIVQLDGTRSVGRPLLWFWHSFLSDGEILNCSDSMPAFKASKPGTYPISLVVFNRNIYSDTDWVFVNVRDTVIKLQAVAGPPDSTLVNKRIPLDGTASNDSNAGIIISYKWQCINGGSLDNPDSSRPNFTASKPNTYLISLVVFSGKDTSAPDYTTIKVKDTVNIPVNQAPIADVGESHTVLFPGQVILNGSKSFDPDSGPLPLKYYWYSDPGNPLSINSIPSIPTPMLGILRPGIYYFTLCVYDGINYSEPSMVCITIIGPDIFVHPDSQYNTLGEGLAAAKAGNTVFVAPGEYFESSDCIMKDSIMLFGIKRDSTIINFACTESNGHVLYLNGVTNDTIKELTFRRGGRSDGANGDVFVGNIVCKEAKNIRLENIVLDSSCHDGLRLIQSSAIKIIKTKIIGNHCNGIRSSASSFSIENSTVSNSGNGLYPFNGISLEGGGTNDEASLNVFIQSTNFQDNMFQHISISVKSRVEISRNTFSGYGGGILTPQPEGTVHFSDNIFGPYKALMDTGDVFLTIYKKTSDTINYRIKWGIDSTGLHTIPIGSANGLVIHFKHKYPGNDSSITVESDGKIKHVFQQHRERTIPDPEWSDSINFKHEEW